MRRLLLSFSFVFSLLAVTLAGTPARATVEQGTALRYLAINVGNASPQYGCWEYKLCRGGDVENVRAYILTWKPDVIMLSEVSRADQLTGTADGGPILPTGWTGRCGVSRDRTSGSSAAWNASDASHEHECVAWKASRLTYVSGSATSAYGRNDAYGQANCDFDFTGFRARLLLDGAQTITAVAVHPDSQDASCRTEEISRYWSQLADGSMTVIGGDWNTESDAELQRPAAFRVHYSRGSHGSLATHSEEYSAVYALGLVRRKLDHAFANFGNLCTSCGSAYGTASLPFGSALGGYDGHPRADGGEGLDHRQILVDLSF